MSEKRSGEDGILDLIAKYFPNRHPHMLLGRGDDCALMTVPQAAALGNSALFAVTSDIFAENAHFRTSYFTASDIGHKALAVNISDLASNGAKPCAFSFNLTLTERQDHAWLEECFQSVADLANQYDMVLCGGDLTKVPLTRTKEKTQEGLDPLTLGGLNIGITAWGTYEHGGVPLMRHRAYAKNLAAEKNAGRSVQADRPVQAGACMREGDILFRIGEIGLARLGLFCLKKRRTKRNARRNIPMPSMLICVLRPLCGKGFCFRGSQRNFLCSSWIFQTGSCGTFRVCLRARVLFSQMKRRSEPTLS